MPQPLPICNETTYPPLTSFISSRLRIFTPTLLSLTAPLHGVVAVNRFDGSIRNVTNSATLNNNVIINELKRNYKDRLESALGGLR
ncbi:hypothetical protein BHR27_02655 [Campylobacter upsaliensis]|nr:hypothetical protein [Campylobacter upsaliensis]